MLVKIMDFKCKILSLNLKEIFYKYEVSILRNFFTLSFWY